MTGHARLRVSRAFSPCGVEPGRRGHGVFHDVEGGGRVALFDGVDDGGVPVVGHDPGQLGRIVAHDGHSDAALRTGRDVVLISTGLMTMRALQAAARLEADHVDVAVLHVPTIKPLDTAAILASAGSDRLIVTLENHTIVGGLAEAVASTLAYAGQSQRIVPIGLPDEFLAAGALPTLHDRYGLSTDAIVTKVRASLTGRTTSASDAPTTA
jgi:deoxyxylulose-5-phosphate synthase